MILTINTSQNNSIELSLIKDNQEIDKSIFEVAQTQAELLLPAIDKLIKKNKLKLADLKEIKVQNRGEGFTSLRIGVITANALGYALGIPVTEMDSKSLKKSDQEFNVVKPEYSREPSIG